MRKTLIVSLFLLFLTILIILISSFFISQRSSFFGKAASQINNEEVSSENSYLFASPLQAKADNQEKIRVTAFILNDQGLGVGSKKVSIFADKGVSITEIQALTDNYGKAVFDISAGQPGEYLISAKVNNTILSQKIKVSFR